MKKGFVWAPVRPDADNIRKAILDSLGGVIADDGQVVAGETIKVYAEKDGKARAVVTITTLDDVTAEQWLTSQGAQG